MRSIQINCEKKLNRVIVFKDDFLTNYSLFSEYESWCVVKENLKKNCDKRFFKTFVTIIDLYLFDLKTIPHFRLMRKGFSIPCNNCTNCVPYRHITRHHISLCTVCSGRNHLKCIECNRYVPQYECNKFMQCSRCVRYCDQCGQNIIGFFNENYLCFECQNDLVQ